MMPAPELGVSSMGFFDEYPRFYQTSQTSPHPHRLNGRHSAVIEPFRLAGKRVLDIASHDGRWAFAALKAGASHVTGIEPRHHLVDHANTTLKSYGVENFQFVVGDVFNVLNGQKFDVVLCLGFLYHTVRHAELFDLMERTGANYVVIDTEVTPPVRWAWPSRSSAPPERMVAGNKQSVQLLSEPVAQEQMAAEDTLTRSGVTLAARPSREAVRFLAKHFGFSTSEYNWPKRLKQDPSLVDTMRDYAERWRSTFYLSRA